MTHDTFIHKYSLKYKKNNNEDLAWNEKGQQHQKTDFRSQPKRTMKYSDSIKMMVCNLVTRKGGKDSDVSIDVLESRKKLER